MRISLALCAFAVLLAALAYVNFTSVHADPEPFDAREWRRRAEQAKQPDPGCVRGGIALTLLDDRQLNKLGKNEVIARLGPAEVMRDDQLRYSLGQCHWDWRQSDLVITVAPDGAVVSVTIEAG
ncbi:hypothetical protein [Ideonella sp.]|jgi:hypothetical protein|uniref:hypothetical protein n=1 Tax=Ideonella sp. TaxID=1929293 RepID=UPI0037BEBACF